MKFEQNAIDFSDDLKNFNLEAELVRQFFTFCNYEQMLFDAEQKLDETNNEAVKSYETLQKRVKLLKRKSELKIRIVYALQVKGGDERITISKDDWLHNDIDEFIEVCKKLEKTPRVSMTDFYGNN